MKLVVILGSGAVGKMTVGQELMKITELRLHHNHMLIEPVIEIFGKPIGALVNRMREDVFEEFAKSDLYGMIFTYMLAWDVPSDVENLDRLVDIFRRRGADIYYVELVAPQEIRLQRNGTENRLKHKGSKRDVATSNARVQKEDASYRLVSDEGEVAFANYLKIDNAEMAPEIVAEMIKKHFGL